jgi:hypothetical protein
MSRKDGNGKEKSKEDLAYDRLRFREANHAVYVPPREDDRDRQYGQFTGKWERLSFSWTMPIMFPMVREVLTRAYARVDAAAEKPLLPDEDADARKKALCDLGQIHVICVLRPSLTSPWVEFVTQYMGESPQGVVTVRMPLPMWETWSKGAQDFCEEICERLRVYATEVLKVMQETHIVGPGGSLTDIVYHCEKAGINPGGCFFMTMQYNSGVVIEALPKQEEPIAVVADEPGSL